MKVEVFEHREHSSLRAEVSGKLYIHVCIINERDSELASIPFETREEALLFLRVGGFTFERIENQD